MGVEGGYGIVGIVDEKDLGFYWKIEYVEMGGMIEGWGKRLWWEYVRMYRIWKEFGGVYVWL